MSNEVYFINNQPITARFCGLTRVEVQTQGSLAGLTPRHVRIKKANGISIPATDILAVTVAENGKTAHIDLGREAFDPPYSPDLGPREGETFSVGATLTLAWPDQRQQTVIAPAGSDYASVRHRLTSPKSGAVSAWLNLNPGVKVGRKLDDSALVGQIGVIRATLMVIDDPGAKTEDNVGRPDTLKADGMPMVTAQDYYDYFVPAARAFLQASSYGLTDMEVTLVGAANATGVYRLSGDNAATYPAERGGNVNTYLLEALELAKADLLAAGDSYDVVYVVATENFTDISYGPTDVRGDKMHALGLMRYGALVRIGQDSYAKFKKKAFIHELGHDLGLPDLYVDAYTQTDPFNGKPDGYPAIGHWGMMSQINSPSHDFLGWEKWQLGWIRNDQVDILTRPGITVHQLTATSVKGGTKLVVIPGPIQGVAYVLEYKRADGVELPPFKEPNKPALEFEGLLVQKVDANNRSMENPITTVNLFPTLPGEQSMSAIDTLARSVLGPKSGVFTFEDRAAGVRIQVPQTPQPADTAAPLTVTVTLGTPTQADRTPMLSEARFLDLCTLECQTGYDLRGIINERIQVLKDGRPLSGVRIVHISPMKLRLAIDAGQLSEPKDMAGVTLRLKAFSFFAETVPCPVKPVAAPLQG